MQKIKQLKAINVNMDTVGNNSDMDIMSYVFVYLAAFLR